MTRTEIENILAALNVGFMLGCLFACAVFYRTQRQSEARLEATRTRMQRRKAAKALP
jgi:hypothetical protein